MKKTMVAIFTLLFSVGNVFAEQEKPFVIVTVTPTGPVVLPEDNPQLQKSLDSVQQQEILSALVMAEDSGDAKRLVEIVGSATELPMLPEEVRKRIEKVILEWTKPIPASDLENNIAGYIALSNVMPSVQSYSDKRAKYEEARIEQRESILKKFKTEGSDFDNVTWYIHRNIPKYTDTRSYVELYIGQQGTATPFLRFKINYTSDKWLFINSAKANIDGQIVAIPAAEWLRDNDSEIWEWMDVRASEQFVDLASRIAQSKKTVIRFDGQQYYDDYTVRDEDKQAIKDALMAFEVLSDR